MKQTKKIFRMTSWVWNKQNNCEKKQKFNFVIYWHVQRKKIIGKRRIYWNQNFILVLRKIPRTLTNEWNFNNFFNIYLIVYFYISKSSLKFWIKFPSSAQMFTIISLTEFRDTLNHFFMKRKDKKEVQKVFSLNILIPYKQQQRHRRHHKEKQISIRVKD